MIQEITQSHYWGVLCSRCKERIPVPRTTAVLYEELKRGEVSEGQDAKSRAFTLRCKVCNEESVYGVKEVLEFEGPPRVRTSERTSSSAIGRVDFQSIRHRLRYNCSQFSQT
jgi:hypothetical protein